MWPTHYIPNQPRLEGTPPPRITLTTPPYPLELFEELETASTSPDLGFVPSAELYETATSAGLPITGELRDVLVTYEMEPEAIESTGDAISGILRDVLVPYEGDPDLLTSSGLPIAATLRDPLVRYENWPLAVDTESLISAGAPVSGELA